MTKLINTNGGCRLPCWWGIAPDVPWNEARQQLAPLATKITDSGPLAENESGAIVTTTNYYIWHQLNGKESQQLTFNVLNDQVRVIHVYPALTEHYLLSQLLTTYGPPSHVWVSTSSIAVNGVQPTFGLSVYYESLGILAGYRSEVSDDGADLVGCFTTARPILRLWNPARNPEIFRIDGQTFAKTLELAEAGYTLETFYETFKNPGTDCIKTPAKLWDN